MTLKYDVMPPPFFRNRTYIEYPIGSMYGIFTYMYHKNQLNVGKYISPMDPMGMIPGNC